MGLILMLLLLGFLPFPLAGLPSFLDDLPPGELADAIIEAMTDEEILGQIFILGYHGTQPSGQIMRWIEESKLGGVKIFTRNIATLTALADSIHQMQSLALENRFHIPLLVATDQEGGWVRHVRSGFSVSPGNMAIGASDESKYHG